MKRFIFLILAAATTVFAACSSDEGTSAYPGKLEVVLTPAWDAVRGMTSSSQLKTVAVALNVESVHWTVPSDSEWCVVDEETSHVGSGEFTVEEKIACLTLGDGSEIELDMIQRWPVRIARPYAQKFAPNKPMNSGQRIIDTLFPIAKGGTAAVPGPPPNTGRCAMSAQTSRQISTRCEPNEASASPGSRPNSISAPSHCSGRSAPAGSPPANSTRLCARSMNSPGSMPPRSPAARTSAASGAKSPLRCAVPAPPSTPSPAPPPR